MKHSGPQAQEITPKPNDDSLLFRFLNSLAGKIRSNPYPYYRLLRSLRPLVKIPPRFWLVLGFSDAAAVLTNRRFGVPDPREISFLPEDSAMTAIWDVTTKILLTQNPPDHTRLRGLMSKAFSASRTNMLRPRIEQIARELLDSVVEAGGMDLIRDYAYPLPVIVIAEMLGVPAADRARFRTWSHEAVRLIEPIRDHDTAARINHTIEAFTAYFSDLIAQRRSAPQDDLISAMISAEESGERLRAEELVPNLMMLLVAGHETTTNLIGNGVLALLRKRSQWEALCQDPTLARSAVEELLRYESPVQIVARIANEHQQLGKRKIKPGDVCVVMIGAANRDPARFQSPHQLDIGRGDRDHLAFGGGIHYCLGANLARLEGEIALATLARRMPELAVSGKPVWRQSINLRGLETLPVSFHPDAALQAAGR